MHIAKLLERHFPKHRKAITTVLALLSMGLLLLGIGLLFNQ